MQRIIGAFPYIGSKYNVVHKLWEYLPKQRPLKYVEPFVGSGVVMLNIIYNKQLGSGVEYVASDFNKTIASIGSKIVNGTFHKELKDAFGDDTKQFGVIPNSKIYERFFEINRNGLETNTLTDPEGFIRAVLSYKTILKDKNGVIVTPTSTLAYKLGSKIENIKKVEEIVKNKNIKVEASSYEKMVEKHDSEDTFFYFDPPYYEKVQIKRAGMIKRNGGRTELKSISNTNYEGGAEFDGDLFVRTLKNIKGKGLLSINSNRGIREQFAEYNINYVPVIRPMKKNKLEYELAITNYKIKDSKQMALFNLDEEFSNEGS